MKGNHYIQMEDNYLNQRNCCLLPFFQIFQNNFTIHLNDSYNSQANIAHNFFQVENNPQYQFYSRYSNIQFYIIYYNLYMFFHICFKFYQNILKFKVGCTYFNLYGCICLYIDFHMFCYRVFYISYQGFLQFDTLCIVFNVKLDISDGFFIFCRLIRYSLNRRIIIVFVRFDLHQEYLFISVYIILQEGLQLMVFIFLIIILQTKDHVYTQYM